jgi:hypothetical protein
VFLTFDGLRDAKVRDRDTRIRIALKGPQAARLWRLLGSRLTDEEKQATTPAPDSQAPSNRWSFRPSTGSGELRRQVVPGCAARRACRHRQ